MKLISTIITLLLISSCASTKEVTHGSNPVEQEKLNRYLLYFRPGEQTRGLARCQFNLLMNGACSAQMLHPPPKGDTWRASGNRASHYTFTLDEETTALLFSEVFRIRRDFPEECIPNKQTWSDTSETGNNITRDRTSNTLCYSIGIYSVETSEWEEYVVIREDSKVLLDSELYKTFSALIAPYEKL